MRVKNMHFGSPYTPDIHHWALKAAPAGQSQSSWNLEILQIKVLGNDSLIRKSFSSWIDLLFGLRKAAGQGPCAASVLAIAVLGEEKLSYVL